jgi:hypothetical protein
MPCYENRPDREGQESERSSSSCSPPLPPIENNELKDGGVSEAECTSDAAFARSTGRHHANFPAGVRMTQRNENRDRSRRRWNENRDGREAQVGRGRRERTGRRGRVVVKS